MQESTLIKIALVCIVVGLVILFFISSKIEISEATISKITKESETVMLKGMVSSIYQHENVAFIKLTQAETIDIVVFTEKNLTLEKGNFIEVIGETETYQGKKQLIAKRLRVIG